MLGVQGIDAPQNEFIDRSTHVVLDVHHFALLGFGSVWLTTTQNGKDHVATEFLLSSQHSRVGEIDHGKEFLQICMENIIKFIE